MFLVHITLIKKKKKQGTRKFLETMDMFIILIVVMVIQDYTYVQAHQIAYINYT